MRRSLTHGANAEVVDEQAGDLAFRINDAYKKSKDLAVNAIEQVVLCGDLLIEQRNNTPEGKWTEWLAENCKDISERTAYKMIKAAKYVHEHGQIDATSVRQLYLEAGAIKEPDAAAPSEADVEKTVLSPLMKSFQTFRAYYTNDRLETMKPASAPWVLHWVNKLQGELAALKTTLVKKFGDHPVEP